jgi:hypothetical protein
MSRDYGVALKAIALVKELQAGGQLPHILCAIDVRLAIAVVLGVEMDSPACEAPMRLCMGELRKEWA